MKVDLKKYDLFRTSHIMILICYTIFTVILIGESVLLQWESWALILLIVGLIVAWIIHFRQTLSEYTRLWIYSLLMMATFFFYGTHPTSTFDLCGVMTAVIMLYTMTGAKPLVVLCEITYILTFIYGIVGMFRTGEEFTSLVVTRSLLHLALVIMAGWIAHVIIDSWGRVLGKVNHEVDELKEGTERLADLLGNVSHEIRTPANAVIGFSGLCLEKEKDEEIRRNMASVMEAGRKISDQISDILDYSEIDRKSLAATKEDFMLSSVVHDVSVQIAALIRPSVELIIDVDPTVPHIMNTDSGKLKKILRHLLENALKYTQKGGVYLHISPLWEEYGVNLCIEVEDTGIGMDSIDLEKALQGYYQGDSSLTRQGQGLGLGLAIVSGFVSALGGFMTIKSKLNVGTSVKVSLPMQVRDDSSCMSVASSDALCLGTYVRFDKFNSPDVREYYAKLMRTLVDGLDVKIHRVESMSDLKEMCKKVVFTHFLVGVEEYEEDPDFLESLAGNTVVILSAGKDYIPRPGSRVLLFTKPVSVFPLVEIFNMDPESRKEERVRMRLKDVHALVVDDELMNLSVARGILGRYEMQVDTALSGYDAIEACKNETYDVIFMDHMMPGMDGIETARKIWQESKAEERDYAIVALTANAVSTAKEMFLKAGFDGFISKPIEIGELEHVLKRVLPKSKIEFVTDQELPSEETAVTGDTASESDKASENIYGGMNAAGIDTDKGLAYCQKDREFYHSLLQQFYSETPEKRARLQKNYELQDHKNYEIYVHALKSTSKMIGAMQLSDLAKHLEEIASSDTDIPDELHIQMMDTYNTVSQAIAKDLNLSVPHTDASDDESVSSENEILEFDAVSEEVLEFSAAPEEEVLEFDAAAQDEIFEFDADPDSDSTYKDGEKA